MREKTAWQERKFHFAFSSSFSLQLLRFLVALDPILVLGNISESSLKTVIRQKFCGLSKDVSSYSKELLDILEAMTWINKSKRCVRG